VRKPGCPHLLITTHNSGITPQGVTVIAKKANKKTIYLVMPEYESKTNTCFEYESKTIPEYESKRRRCVNTSLRRCLNTSLKEDDA
jgi:hypothetical protein